jgi:23S rRNA (guanine745-N1)-methyltransferase
MLDRAVAALRCPHCHDRLSVGTGALRCPSGHSFDLARQGYVSLLAQPLGGIVGDSADMLDARDRLFAGGHYRPLLDRVAGAVRAAGEAPLVLEVGAGSGHYLVAALDAHPSATGIALDVSKAAARRLARAHDRAAAVLADLWHAIPVGDGAADVLMCVFAPRNPAEFARVLHPRGHLVVVTPAEGHLAELTLLPGVLRVEAGKEERLDASLAANFTLTHREHVTFVLALTRPEAALLLLMGPTARHLTPAQIAALLDAVDEPVTVTAAATLSVYRPLAGGHT